MNGCVNTVYTRHAMMEEILNAPGGNCFSQYFTSGLIDPYYFDGTATNENYIKFLHGTVIE